MSAVDQHIYTYLIGGQSPLRAASLTGDISQMEKALVARILQSTSPGLTGNDAGSLGEQIQRLIDLYAKTNAVGLPSSSVSGSPLQRLLYAADKLQGLDGQLLSTTPNAQAANAAGSLAQQIAFLAANLPLIPDNRAVEWVPDFFSSFGFRGDLIDAVAGTAPNGFTTSNLVYTGWQTTATGAGSGVVPLQANPAGTQRPRTLMVRAGAASGDKGYFRGMNQMAGSTRYVYQPAAANSFLGEATEWVIEANIVMPNVTNVQFFFGCWDEVGADPQAGTARSCHIYHHSAYSANFHAFTNNAGSASPVDMSVAHAANTSFRLRMRLQQGAVKYRVNAGAETTILANIPTVQMVPYVMIAASAAGNKDLHVEWIHDKLT